MHVQAFSLVARSTLEAVQAALSACVSAWAAQWGVAADSVSVLAERASEAAHAKAAGAPAWSRHLGAPARSIWLGHHQEWQAELQRAMFAPDGTFGPQGDAQPHFAPAAAHKAFESLLDRIARVALLGIAEPAILAGKEPPAAQFARGAGAVLAVVKLGKQQCRVLLDHASVAALRGAPVTALPALKPVSFQQTLAEVPVALTLSAGSTRVSMGSLVSLAPGDVIRLDTGIDAAFALRSPSGVPLLDAYLGRVGEDMAVEIASRK